MHTRHGLEVGLRIVESTMIVAIHTNPVHMTAFNYFLLPDNRNIVLGLASYGTRLTSNTRSEVDRHPPLVLLVFPQREHRVNVRDAIFFRSRELRIFMIFSERRDTEWISLLHRLRMLGSREDIPA